eukprot:8087904-Pyramimonas_sp.AAC.1
MAVGSCSGRCGGSGGYSGHCTALGSCGGNCGGRQAAVGTAAVAGLQWDLRWQRGASQNCGGSGAAAASAVVAGLQWKLQSKGFNARPLVKTPTTVLNAAVTAEVDTPQ